MDNAPQLIYWDSCVIISYFNNEPERITTIEAILEDVSQSGGKKKIVTSTVAKVEVAFVSAEKTELRLTDEAEKIIDDFWADDSVLELIEFHDDIAKLARGLIRDGIPRGWKTLRPMDAIHLATAKWIEASELHTYNLQDFERYQPQVGIKICEPYAIQPKLF